MGDPPLIKRNVVIRRTNQPKGIDGRWFEIDGTAYGVTYNGPRWGWAIHSVTGAVVADGYDTLHDLRADASRAIREASDV